MDKNRKLKFCYGNKTNSPVDIAKAAINHAKMNNYNIVILDTAGRLHVDEDMMTELIQIKEQVYVRPDGSCCRCDDRTRCSHGFSSSF